MRILPVSSYNNNFQSHINNNKNISFKSVYSDRIDEIAEKLQYVKDPSDLIYDELNKYYSIWEISGMMTWDVQRRIEELRYERELRDARLQNIETSVNAKEGQIRTEAVVHGRLSSEINEIQRKNAIEKIKLSKISASYERIEEVNTQLENNYVNLFKLDEKKFPNAIMISGLQGDSEKNSVLDYLNRTHCKVLKMDFENIPLSGVVKEISGVASKNKKNGEHSLLYIENFDKYTVPTEENMDFISKFKGFLCGCSAKSNTTVLVFENNPKRLDENIIGGHRFEKKIDVSGIKPKIPSVFCPKYDGYTFFYDDNEDSCIDLYLGDSGKNPNLLWADTISFKKVQDILSRLDEIKAQDKFKYAKYLQIPYPNEEYSNDFYVLPYRRTYDDRMILEREI